MTYFLGVDVGTESVRVGLFDSNGSLIESQVRSITVYNFKADYYEQSSSNIWDSVCSCIKEILSNCNSKLSIKTQDIVSIGFDATCSLVVLDDQFNSVTVSPSSNPSINVIMWMDHRSKQQANFINSTKHSCLKSVGNLISPEMDPPKILWLKQNMPDECFNKAAHFFSLSDFLVWRSSNQCVRSICCTVCKWLYQSNETDQGWDDSFWTSIGLSELATDGYKRIGSNVKKPFSFITDLKVSYEMAKETGLSQKVKIGVSMIDAHAGGVGGLSVTFGFLKNLSFEKYFSSQCQIEDILVLVAGTSSCLMASSKSPKVIDGIWGPYYEAMAPSYWLNEAGQSACGKLIDHVVKNHPAYLTHQPETGSIFERLNDVLAELAISKGFVDVSMLTKNIHVYPDFHGNRSPLADSSMCGMISGLSFDVSLENLALQYLACIQSLAYQTRQIISEMNSHGFQFKIINIIGGLANNKLYCQLHSDVCNLPVLVSKSDSSVLLGSAILGASNYFEGLSFTDLLSRFSENGATNSKIILPNNNLKSFHEKKYKVFLKMLSDQQFYRDLMN